MKACGKCRSGLENFRSMVRAVRESERVEPPAYLAEKVARSIYGAEPAPVSVWKLPLWAKLLPVASAAILFAVAAGVYYTSLKMERLAEQVSLIGSKVESPAAWTGIQKPASATGGYFAAERKYYEGMNMMSARDYSSAVKVFSEVIYRYPNTPWAEESAMRISEIKMAQRDGV